MILISLAGAEVYGVHDAVGLLQEVECPLVLFFLDEGNGTLVKLSQNNRYLILRDPQFFVVMFVEEVILLSLGIVLLGCVSS